MCLFGLGFGYLAYAELRRMAVHPSMAEVADLTRTAMRVLRAVSAPHGFNLGMNQGEVAGAGIAAHLHQHAVPRWPGDANFLPVVGRTRALPELLSDTRARLAAAWPAAPAGDPAGAERG